MIFLDTSILSISYRRKYHEDMDKPFEVKLLEKMIENNEPLFIAGIVLQEFLAGVKEESQFQKLYKLGEYFPIVMRLNNIILKRPK